MKLSKIENVAGIMEWRKYLKKTIKVHMTSLKGHFQLSCLSKVIGYFKVKIKKNEQLF